MTPIKGPRERHWTQFELQTLLALMAKGVHLEGRSKRKDDPGSARHAAQLNFATELNKALHGNDFRQDISKKEITRMVEKMMVERKHVVGKGGLMERQGTARLTRSLRMAWETNRKMDFNGSIGEWKDGRKLVEINKERVAKGLPPMEVLEEDEDEDGENAAAEVEEHEKEVEEQWAIATTQRKLLLAKGLVPRRVTSPSPFAPNTQGAVGTHDSSAEPLAQSDDHGDGYISPFLLEPATSNTQRSNELGFGSALLANTSSVSPNALLAQSTRIAQSKDVPAESPYFNRSRVSTFEGLRATHPERGYSRPGDEDIDMDVEMGSEADADDEWEEGEIV
ncbi:uncharacterized protein BP5553_04858 [Venustampulla echinocandica]|uniref:Uncharacterized protein n=1 Tax=Venustampulla echinocandica TaxID=2656787 RepID=A0A370TPH7_9HELO|nr:uncharacterized protein BP5553_04858 [Venustampulla echinocandica]RDL37425.1 hypothetical protein BP5553_04858 [Venustampulla echinocandica]